MSIILKPTLGSQLNLGHRLSQGLVGYWLLNEGSGNIVSDLSRNGITGTLTGTVPSWTAGKFGSAVLLPGTNEYVDFGDTNNMGTSDFGIGIWIKTNTAASNPRIITKEYNTAQIGWGLYLDLNNGRLGIFIRDNNSSTLGTFGTTPLYDNIFHHIFVAFNRSGNAIIYVDGVQDGTVDISSESGSIDNTQNLLIGARYNNGAPGVFFNGIVDLPMLYNRALIASEIAELYQEPFGMFDRMPIELWVGATSVGAPPAVGNPWNYYAQIA